MANGKLRLKGGETLGPDNFRAFAAAVVQKYADKDMIADAMIWGQILACYEAALTKAWAEGAMRARGADIDTLGLESLLAGNPYKKIE